MSWNYVGIDPNPPKRATLLILMESGHTAISNGNNPNMIAWTTIPKEDAVKRKCQIILRGLPELHMVSCIIGAADTYRELVTALAHYDDREDLASFTDLVRALDRKAHNGAACIPHIHG
jgi:hypothetical protein